MKKKEYVDTCVIYDDGFTPTEHAEWENFISQASEDEPNMYALETDGGGVLVSSDVREFLELDNLKVLRADYPNMDYLHADHIISWVRTESDHWDTIITNLENLGNDILRFLIIKKIPLEFILRFMLSLNLVDRDGNPCTKEEAEKAWDIESPFFTNNNQIS